MTASITTKACKKCGEVKPATREHFGSTPSGGLRHTCRTCVNLKSKSYARANPESVRARARKRQASADGFIPSDALKTHLFHEQGGVCALCCEPMDETAVLDPLVLQVEHLTPVSRGGTNDEANLVLAHRTCNQEKKQKTVPEYLEWRERVGLPALTRLLSKVTNALTFSEGVG